MKIGGWQKTTLLDYPGKVAATIFIVGCNFRCHFCHNPELVISPIKAANIITQEAAVNFLKTRQKLLDAVCITGGEPTIHQALPNLINKIKKLGYLIKLDTNGTNPGMLEQLIKQELIDYIAMDIKAPWEKYQKIVNAPVNLEKIKKSVIILKQSGLPYEFRSTVIPRLHNKADIIKMAQQIKPAQAYYLQRFKPAEKLVDQDFVNKKKFLLKDLENIRKEIKDWFEKCDVR